MPTELFRADGHQCLMFTALCDEGGGQQREALHLARVGAFPAALLQGGSELIALPAHFLHAEDNFQFYDPVSRILFSGDLGASMGSGAQAQQPVTSLAEVLPRMEGFHRRYMVSNKVLRLWAQMVRPLRIDMMVPQHGAALAGPAVKEFIAWAEGLSCGIDLMTERDYRVPA